MNATHFPKTLVEILKAADIVLPSMVAGTYRARCPRCKKGARDDALGVPIEYDRTLMWHCFRCSWRGRWCPWKPMRARPKPTTRTLHSETSGTEQKPGLFDYGQRLWAEAKPIVAEDLASRYLTQRCCA